MKCQACGDRNSEILHPVLPRFSDSEHDQSYIYVCENCVSQFERVTFLIQRMDGTLFPIEEQPAWWKNDTPLDYVHNHIIYYMLEQQTAHLNEEQRLKYLQDHALNPAHLPLNDFPLVEDFQVSLEGVIAKHELHRKRIGIFSAYLYSPTLGYLGSFSGHIKSHYMCRSDFVIPSGDFTLPYYDFDQGIDQIITEDEQFVYVLSGNHYISSALGIETHYYSWVKVKREQYYEQWEIAIQWSRNYHRNDSSELLEYR